jgi:ABC-type multidrug transport system fused ATPase/permease subunit
MLLLDFTKIIFKYFSNRLLVVLCFLVIGAFLEGFGLLLLVPILQLTIGGNESNSTYLEWLQSLLAAFDLEFDLKIGLGLFLVFFVGQSLILYLRDAKVATSISEIRLWLRERLYEAMINAKFEFFYKEKKGNLINAIVVECDKAGNAIYQFMLLWTTLATTLVYLTAAVLISWEITGTLVMLGSLFVLVIKRKAKGGRQIGEITSETNGIFQTLLNEHFDSVKLIKGSALEKFATILMHHGAQKLADLERNVLKYNAKIKNISEPIIVSILCLGVYLSVSFFKMDMAEMMVVLFIFFRLFPRIIQSSQLYFQTLVFIPSFEKVESMTERAFSIHEPYVGVGKRFISIKRNIKFQDIRFSYDGEKSVIDGLTIEITKGETIALVGGSGAGKTTTSDLVLGLVWPDSGKILIDDLPLKNYDLRTWRKKVSYVTQDTILLHDSVKANIMWGAEDACSDEEISHFAKLANAHDFIKKLPDQYDTIIGDKGMRLSGGQRQRLVLARALARKPELLILDEATSALDTESELEVQKAIDNLGSSVTKIIIAHRLSTVKKVNCIYVLESGRIVESGKWDWLIEKEGRLSQLYKMQHS